MVLLNLSDTGITGQVLQDRLASVNITSNKNPIPFDAVKPSEWRGLRLGVAAATTRGFDEGAFARIGSIIADLVATEPEPSALQTHRDTVQSMCDSWPIYPGAGNAE